MNRQGFLEEHTPNTVAQSPRVLWNGSTFDDLDVTPAKKYFCRASIEEIKQTSRDKFTIRNASTVQNTAEQVAMPLMEQSVNSSQNPTVTDAALQ
jgi:hypothetical protein